MSVIEIPSWVDLKFKKYIDLFDRAVESENHQLLKKLLNLIKENESIFLDSYNKRKKEGVYYTNEEISKFIISKVIIELINKTINQFRNFNTEIKNFMDINLLEPTVKEDITKILLNLSICDPTCGSGVFLVSAANILFELIQNLSKKVNPILSKILEDLRKLDPVYEKFIFSDITNSLIATTFKDTDLYKINENELKLIYQRFFDQIQNDFYELNKNSALETSRKVGLEIVNRGDAISKLNLPEDMLRILEESSV